MHEVVSLAVTRLAVSRSEQLTAAGLDPRAMFNAGLFKQRDNGGHYDAFRDAVERYLVQERREIDADIQYVSDNHSPFRSEE